MALHNLAVFATGVSTSSFARSRRAPSFSSAFARAAAAEEQLFVGLLGQGGQVGVDASANQSASTSSTLSFAGKPALNEAAGASRELLHETSPASVGPLLRPKQLLGHLLFAHAFKVAPVVARVSQ